MDPPVFGSVLPQTAAQNQRRPGQPVRRGRHSRNVSVSGHLVVTLWASIDGLWDFAPFLSCFNFLRWNLSFLGPVLKRSQHQKKLLDFCSPKAPKTFFLKQILLNIFFFFYRSLRNFEVKRHKIGHVRGQRIRWPIAVLHFKTEFSHSEEKL